jgi:hypothetical protein
MKFKKHLLKTAYLQRGFMKVLRIIPVFGSLRLSSSRVADLVRTAVEKDEEKKLESGTSHKLKANETAVAASRI